MSDMKNDFKFEIRLMNLGLYPKAVGVGKRNLTGLVGMEENQNTIFAIGALIMKKWARALH